MSKIREIIDEYEALEAQVSDLTSLNAELHKQLRELRTIRNVPHGCERDLLAQLYSELNATTQTNAIIKIRQLTNAVQAMVR